MSSCVQVARTAVVVTLARNIICTSAWNALGVHALGQRCALGGTALCILEAKSNLLLAAALAPRVCSPIECLA